jgi:hypothetical protein
MPRLLVASSPVEIEATGQELELPTEVLAIAMGMFHALTDRLARAVVALEVLREDWPNHRFYFGTDGGEMGALLDGLRTRHDIVDVSQDVAGPQTSGLYVVEAHAPYIGVLVGHANHEGMLSTSV